MDSAPAQRVAAKDNAFSLPTLAVFREMTDRPLFFVSRRPPPPPQETVEAEVKPPPVPQVALAGTLVSPDGRLALLKMLERQAMVRLREGQDIGGWTVHQVLADRVVLRLDDRRHEVRLKDGVDGASRSQTADGRARPRGDPSTRIRELASDSEP